MGFFQVFGGKGASVQVISQRPTVLLPLYIYPSPSSWQPLYTALETYPSLPFTLIVNPNSGPGSAPMPDENYVRELTKLNTYPNVRMVGYVSTNWAKRPFSAVVQDIRIYKGWDAEQYPITGIFFDETPTEWSRDAEEFLKGVNHTARSSLMGLGSGALIIHNPGAVPDPRLMGDGGPDVSVVVESTYRTLTSSGITKSISAMKLDGSRLASMIHSLPTGMSAKDRAKLVRQLKGLTGNVFITELDTDVYSSFGQVWAEFVKEMDG